MQPASAPKITRLSKALAAGLVALFALQFFVPISRSYLALVPGRTLPCVWNLVTAGFITTNAFKLAAEVTLVLLLSRLVEPVYGSREFLKFLLVVDFSVCFATFVGVYIIFAATNSLEGAGNILYIEFAGFHGIVAGLFVAVKQVMPDHELKLFSVLKLRVKFVPTLLLVVAVGVCLALQWVEYIPFLVLGTYNAWIYLRFFQQQPDAIFRGDPSDDFKFSSFFPPLLETPIDALAGLLGLIFRLRHVPGSPGTEEGKAALLAANLAPSLLGSDAADANRRRERGAKALEERLGMKKAAAGDDLEGGAGEAVRP